MTAFTHKHHGVLEPYYFWLARFGGNANGHVIRGDAGPSEEYLPGERCTTPPSQGLPLTYSRERVVVRSLLGGPWVAVAQNVDDDLTWTCPTNPAPEGFMDRLRAVVERETVTYHTLAEVHHLLELLGRVRLHDLLCRESAERQVLLLDVVEPRQARRELVRVVRAHD